MKSRTHIKPLVILALVVLLTCPIIAVRDEPCASPPAWSGKKPVALPPGLQNHSMPQQAWENGLKRFAVHIEMVNRPKAQSETAAVIKDDIITYYHNDHLGTPLYMTDETGAIVWRREQAPFGETTLERGAQGEELRFPGQYKDTETGLSYNRFRDYDPKTGRYIEPDPIGQGGMTSGAYAVNSRLTKVLDAATHAVKAEYVYDGLGRRVKKVFSNTTTCFVYDLSGQLITELDGSGNWKDSRAYLDGEPLARFDVGKQNPDNPSASPYSTSACLTWDAVAGAAHYAVCYGNTAGSWNNCFANISTTSYCVDGLANALKYFFVVNAYDSGNNAIGQSDEVNATPEPGKPSLPHYSYSAVLGGQADCTICHIQRGTFLTSQGFGVRTSVNLCHSCHNAAGVGHDRPYGGKAGHPVFVNVTVNVTHRRPSLGFVNGTSSDKTYTHLYKGKQVVCMTCHNSKAKPNDPGRSWEFTTTTDYTTYFLQNGGWTYNAYLKPTVYRDTSLWTGPTMLKDRKKYIVAESKYDVDPDTGVVVFHTLQSYSSFIYVTLGNDYLRNTNINNQLCLDCHVTETHKGADCTICHGTHNTANLYNVRERLGTPVGIKDVKYKNVSGLSGSKGACVVCHTVTLYHNATSHMQVPHYEDKNCVTCHPHREGFPSFTTY